MLGFIGLGHMGEPMALKLLASNMPLIAWSRSTAKYPLITAAGGEAASSVQEVFDKAHVVILMLANGPAIDAALGRGTDEFREMVSSHVVVHMGTTTPSYSEGLAVDIRDSGGDYVEAPVSGSRKPAEAGELIGMLAGAPAVLDEIRSLLAPMLLKSVDCGQVPNALRMKLAVNLFLITQVVGLVEAFNFARSYELDLRIFRDVLDSGPMASAVSRNKLAKLVEADFAPQASVRDVHYNSRLVSAAVRAGGLVSPLIEAATELFEVAERLGFEDDDMVAVVRALDPNVLGA